MKIIITSKIKVILFSIVLTFLGKHNFAQIVICDTVPISFDSQTMSFGSTVLSFGDSSLNIKMINNSNTGFAYPLAKIIPQSPLPAGMTFANASLGWTVFASAWNPGDTANCEYFFNVNQPIPTDFSVTFLMYVSNFLPLTIDSCVFANTFAFNFNPSIGLGIANKNESSNEKQFSIFPNPSNRFFYVDLKNEVSKNEILIIEDVSGKIILEEILSQNQAKVSLEKLNTGIYFASLRNKSGKQKIIVN